MGMFDQLNSFFRVGNTISQSSNTQPDDVLKTKKALAQTGDYTVPDYGITDIPDMGMIDGLKKFQQKNGLKVDGVMKPGGPTEAKLGETMANQGISNTDLLESTQPKQKPQPKKIDPLTGLPQVKMPKLKKSKANPWFQSSKIKPVKDEAHSANARTMDGLLQYSKNGSLPALYANSLQNGDEKAVHEYANFMQQLSDRKGDRVDIFHKEVVSLLPENVKQVFAQLQMDNDEGEAAMGANIEPKFSKRIEEQSAENVQRSKKSNETASKDNTKGNAQDKRKPDESIEEFCAALPGMIQKSKDDQREYQRKYDAAAKKVKELPEKIKRQEHDLRLALASYAASVGKDIMSLPWTSVWGVVVSAANAAVGAIDLRDKYTRINKMKNDKTAETDTRTYKGLIDSEKAHMARLKKTQSEKCK